jgi:hypothetical protein
MPTMHGMIEAGHKAQANRVSAGQKSARRARGVLSILGLLLVGWLASIADLTGLSPLHRQ